MTAPGREKPRRVKRGETSCQLCRPDWGGRKVPQALVIVAGYRICERHLEILIALLEGK